MTSLFLGYLALTKVFFGYVILTELILFLLFFLVTKKNALRKAIWAYLFALLFCIPYLTYTYTVSGKFFYWGNSGGENLYWMSSPYDSDLGDWHTDYLRTNPERYKRHIDFFKEISKLNGIKRDAALKRKAIENIVNAPRKYLYNWTCNIGRLFFNYPYSFTPQKLSTFFYIIPNMFIVVLSVLCVYPTYKVRKNIPAEIFFILLFGLIAIGGTSLLTAGSRLFQPLVPVFTFWIFFTLARLLKIEVRYLK